jgi:hypothetical protein
MCWRLLLVCLVGLRGPTVRAVAPAVPPKPWLQVYSETPQRACLQSGLPPSLLLLLVLLLLQQLVIQHCYCR